MPAAGSVPVEEEKKEEKEEEKVYSVACVVFLRLTFIFRRNPTTTWDSDCSTKRRCICNLP